MNAYLGKDGNKAIEVLSRVHDWLGVVIRDGKCGDFCSVCLGASDLADDVWDVLHPEGVKKSAPAAVVKDAPKCADFVHPSCPITGGKCKMQEQNDPAAKVKPQPMDKLESRVIDTVAEQLCVDRRNVTMEADFVDDLGADSLDRIELVLAFEEEFGLCIPEEDAANVHTPRQAVEYLRSKGY